MFKEYESKPIVRLAYQVSDETDIRECDEESTSLLMTPDGFIKFKHYEPVSIGDYIVHLSDDDVYHCTEKVFAERNIIDTEQPEIKSQEELEQINTVVLGAGSTGTVHIQEVMTEFQCHKVVKAAVIKQVTGFYIKGADLALVIGLPGTDIEIPYLATADMVNRFEPVVGDYVVLYENDYVAISPKQPFEDGYSQLNFVDIGDEEEVFVPESAVDQITNLSRVAHGVLVQYAKAYGQDIKPWSELDKNEQQHVIARVAHFMTYPDAEAGAPHEAWRMRHLLNGWQLGKTFDPNKKTRPDLVLFGQLPQEQQATDHILKGIVHETFYQQ